MGGPELPESSDTFWWNSGDRGSSSSNRGQGEAKGLKVGLCSVELEPPPSLSAALSQSITMETGLQLRSREQGCGLDGAVSAEVKTKNRV